MNERRRHPRWVIDGTHVTWKAKGKAPRNANATLKGSWADVMDIGTGGVSFMTEAPPAQGSPVFMLVQMPDDDTPFTVSGTVAWARCAAEEEPDDISFLWSQSTYEPGKRRTFGVGVEFDECPQPVAARAPQLCPAIADALAARTAEPELALAV